MARVKEPEVPEPDLALANETVMAAVRLTRTLRALTRSSGLSGPRISALAVVVHAGRIAARDLAQFEEVTAATISRLVTALEEDGLVTRSRDERDTRVQWIVATAQGKRLIEQGHRKRLLPLARRIARLSDAERAHLAAGAALSQRLVREMAEEA